jgi:hypothetical protein
VVLINSGEQVKLIMRFDHETDGWPFMYHCHNLMHEDNMMMLQFVVLPLGTWVQAMEQGPALQLFPSPTHSWVKWHTSFPVEHLRVTDMLGRQVMQKGVAGMEQDVIDLSMLPAGRYFIELRGGEERVIGTVVKE